VFRSNYQDLQAQAIYCFAQICSNYVKNAAASVLKGLSWRPNGSPRGICDSQPMSPIWIRITQLSQRASDHPPDVLRRNYLGPIVRSIRIRYERRRLFGVPTNFAPRLSGLIRGTYTAALPRGYKLISEVSPFFSTRYNNQDPT